jgi:SAM-dependent methyltransferase
MRPSQAESYDTLEDQGILYDHVTAYRERPDIAFFVEEMQSVEGPILELASGTGRVMIPIARSGKTIVGLERSRRMLDRCQLNVSAEPPEVRARIALREGDMRDFDLGETFAAAIIPFRPFQHLVSVSDQLDCLGCVHRHLAPNGRLVFDVFNPDLGRIASPPIGEFDDTPEVALPDGSHFRRTGRIVAAHKIAQTSDLELIYYVTSPTGATERRVHAFQMRWFLRAELEHLLARAGFEIVAAYGNFDRSPLVDESPEIVIVARRVGE